MDNKPEQGQVTSAEMKRIMTERADMINGYLRALPRLLPSSPPMLMRAMEYSLMAGGKRIRPVLCLSCAALCNLEAQKILPFAAAIEMVHTYSLIHDDLPAMDNDDTRRGMPTCHKAFGEATGILAGDGLLTDAFYIMTLSDLPAARTLRALAFFAQAAGSSGMVGGQMLDIWFTGKTDAGFEELLQMQAMKTGAILQASCVCAALLADASAEVQAKLSAYGKHLGSAFQIADDVLDIVGDAKAMGKAVGKDDAQGKFTCPSVIGLEESIGLARKEAALARAALDSFSDPEADFLRALASYVVNRFE